MMTSLSVMSLEKFMKGKIMKCLQFLNKIQKDFFHAAPDSIFAFYFGDTFDIFQGRASSQHSTSEKITSQ